MHIRSYLPQQRMVKATLVRIDFVRRDRILNGKIIWKLCYQLLYNHLTLVRKTSNDNPINVVVETVGQYQLPMDKYFPPYSLYIKYSPEFVHHLSEEAESGIIVRQHKSNKGAI
jgi:hypothetical protein